jgi:hypothetical protein
MKKDLLLCPKEILPARWVDPPSQSKQRDLIFISTIRPKWTNLEIEMGRPIGDALSQALYHHLHSNV